MKEAFKHLGGWFSAVSVLVGFAMVFYHARGWEDRLWDNPKQKWEHQEHVNRTDTIMERIEVLSDTKTKNEEHAIRSRQHRDSILDRTMDISYMNAVQIEKIISKQDSIYKWWQKYNESVEDDN